MTAHYLNARVLFVVVGATLLVLVSFAFTRASSPPLPFHFGTSNVTESPSDGLLEHAGNETLGFHKIFVINLPARYDHRDSMSLAAALSGLQIEYIDGVTDVSTDYMPPGPPSRSDGSLGAWRAHMNVLRRIIEQNLTTALVLEDDVDWDLRIKSQMQQFAKASRLLLQPLPGTTDKFLDPTYPHPVEGQDHQDFDIEKETVSKPTTSPYGDTDRWDLFWLGHCGARFPHIEDQTTPLGRAVIFNDATVPEPQHIDPQLGGPELTNKYPAHTRVVSRVHGNTCTLAYGITQAGARRFFYELAVRKKDSSADLMFKRMCDGIIGRKQRNCLSVQPQLFQHHRPVANKATFSDINGHGKDYNEMAFTRNIRWSTRVNFAKLVDAEIDYIDLFKDGEEARKDLG